MEKVLYENTYCFYSPGVYSESVAKIRKSINNKLDTCAICHKEIQPGSETYLIITNNEHEKLFPNRYIHKDCSVTLEGTTALLARDYQIALTYKHWFN